MLRFLLAAVALVATTVASQAHFVFVLPDATGKVEVVFSDALAPDEGVAITKIAGLKLVRRDAAGKEAPVALEAGKVALAGKLPDQAPALVYGSVPNSVLTKGTDKPYLLVYHPRAFVGDLQAQTPSLGEKLPVEVLARREGAGLSFGLVAGGKPVPGGEVNVLLPDGNKVKTTTGKDGWTTTYQGPGRYGVWARHIVPTAGTHDGMKYEEARHYATLVVDLPARK